jgi:hypothetical protein
MKMSEDIIKINFNISEKLTDILIQIWVLINPSFWLMNYQYSKDWDSTLNHLMDNHNFIIKDKYTAVLGGKNIWIANHPYASFTEYDYINDKVRPSRKTIFKAMMKLKREKHMMTPTHQPVSGVVINESTGHISMYSGASETYYSFIGDSNDNSNDEQYINGIPSNWNDEIDLH